MLFSKSPKKKSLLKSLNNPLLGSNTPVTKMHTIQRENLYLRIVKKGIIFENFGNLAHKETTTNNSSFVETIIKDLTKQILCSKEFKDNFTKQVKEQPLSIYKWTNNQTLPSLGSLREKYIVSLKLLVLSQIGDTSETRAKRKTIMDGKLTSHSKFSNSQIRSNKHKSSTKLAQFDIPILDIKEQEEYNDSLDKEIEEKYLKDLSIKYKYSIKELNEKIILINDETKKLISDTIMENTIYNLINQTVYGEMDLTVKPRIYFFLGKGNNYNVSESANINSLQGSTEIKNENNLLKSQISDNDKNNNKKENDIKETEKNSNLNSARKEEKNNNISIGSKNSKKTETKNV